MKVWHISDTHTYHGMLEVPTGIDMIIHSGDLSIDKNTILCKQNSLNFIEWYKSLDIKHKIFVAGNHDLDIERRMITPADFAKAGIIYLENSTTTVEGLKIWGSPITPAFGEGWAYNRKREKIDSTWRQIPDGTDIVITHGPPKGVLDISLGYFGKLEQCGCKSLRRHIHRVKPKLHLFGHIHNCDGVTNAGYTVLASMPETIFSNGSVVTDGKFGILSSNGNVLEI
jgi:Icc-related predicted phosphoesterase